MHYAYNGWCRQGSLGVDCAHQLVEQYAGTSQSSRTSAHPAHFLNSPRFVSRAPQLAHRLTSVSVFCRSESKSSYTSRPGMPS